MATLHPGWKIGGFSQLKFFLCNEKAPDYIRDLCCHPQADKATFNVTQPLYPKAVILVPRLKQLGTLLEQFSFLPFMVFGEMLLGKILFLRLKFPASNFSFTLHVWPTTEWFCRARLGKFCRDASQPRCSTSFTTGRRKANLSPSSESKEINATNNFIGQNFMSVPNFWISETFLSSSVSFYLHRPRLRLRVRVSGEKDRGPQISRLGEKFQLFSTFEKILFLLWEETVPWAVLSVRIYYFCIQCIAN